MLLDGAKFILMDENGKAKQTIIAKGKKFTIGGLVDCDCVLEEAESVHCQIECDAFGHVTIHNKSQANPISVNGETVVIKKTLFNNSHIKILDRDYVWQHATATSTQTAEEGLSTPNKQIGTMLQQQPNSCPTLKNHRNLINRLTVHNLRAYRIDSDESNCADDDDDDDDDNDKDNTTAANVELSRSCDAAAPNDCDSTPAKVDLIDSTTDKKTSSTEKRMKTLRNVLGWSGMTTTSCSPRIAGVRVEKTFTALIAPTTRRSNSCRTPKGLLERLGDGGVAGGGGGVGGCGKQLEHNELIVFATPAKQSSNERNTSLQLSGGGAGILVQHKKSAMKIVDLTTPSKLRPASPFRAISSSATSVKKSSAVKSFASFTEKSAVKPKPISMTPMLLHTPKCLLSQLETPVSTPSSAITVDSSSAASDVSGVQQQSTTAVNVTNAATPNPQKTLHATPGSILRKQALLASAKKQQTSTTTTAALTPLTTKRKMHNSTIAAADQSKCSKQLPTARKLLAAESTLNATAKLTDAGVPSSTTKIPIKDGKNYLTTSTPYKVVAMDATQEQQQHQDTNTSSEFFSALHCTNEIAADLVGVDETTTTTTTTAITEKTATAAVAVAEDDQLLQQIEEILNTSDELKRQLQAQTTNEAAAAVAVNDVVDVDDESNAMILTVSPPPASIDLIEPNDSKLKNATPKSNVVIASVLLRAIDNAEKQKAAAVLAATATLSPKEDEEKENKINKIVSSTTPTLSTTPSARRRISLSTPAVAAAAAVTEEAVNVESTSTHQTPSAPLTPKRIAKHCPANDEVATTTPAANHTIDDFNTEDMGAIVEENVVAAIASTDENDQVSANLHHSAVAPSDIRACRGPTSDSKKSLAKAVDNDVDAEVVMSPLQCLDESFAEPCQNADDDDDDDNDENVTQHAANKTAETAFDATQYTEEYLDDSTISELNVAKNPSQQNRAVKITLTNIENKESTLQLDETFGEIEYLEDDSGLLKENDKLELAAAENEDEQEQLNQTYEIKETATNTTTTSEIVVEEQQLGMPNEISIIEAQNIEEIEQCDTTMPNKETFVDLTINDSLEISSSPVNETSEASQAKNQNDQIKEQQISSISVTDADVKAQTPNDEKNEKHKATDEIISIDENVDELLVKDIEVTQLIAEEHSDGKKIIEARTEKLSTTSTKRLLETSNIADNSNFLTKMNVTQMTTETENEVNFAENQINLSISAQAAVIGECKERTVEKLTETSTFLEKLEVTRLLSTAANGKAERKSQATYLNIEDAVEEVKEMQSDKQINEVKEEACSKSVEFAENQPSEVKKDIEALETSSLAQINAVESSPIAEVSLENSRISPDLFETDATMPKHKENETTIDDNEDVVEVAEIVEKEQIPKNTNEAKVDDMSGLELLDDTIDETDREIAANDDEQTLLKECEAVAEVQKQEISQKVKEIEQIHQETNLETPTNTGEKLEGTQQQDSQQAFSAEEEKEKQLAKTQDKSLNEKKELDVSRETVAVAELNESILLAKETNNDPENEMNKEFDNSATEKHSEIELSHDEQQKLKPVEEHEAVKEQPFEIDADELETEKPTAEVHEVVTEQPLEKCDSKEKTVHTSELLDAEHWRPLEISDDKEETVKPSEILEPEIGEKVKHSEPNVVKADQPVKPCEVIDAETDEQLEVEKVETPKPAEILATKNEQTVKRSDQLAKPGLMHDVARDAPLEISDDEEETEKPAKAPESEVEQTEKPTELHDVGTDQPLEPADEVLETEKEQPLEISEDEEEAVKLTKVLKSEISQTLTPSELHDVVKDQEVDPAEILNAESVQPLQISDDEEDTNKSSKAPESEVRQTEKKTSEVLEIEKEQSLEISDDENETEQPSNVLESKLEQTEKASELHDVEARQPAKPSKELKPEIEQSLEISDDEEETEKPSKVAESEIGQTVTTCELHDDEIDQQVEPDAEQPLQISDDDKPSNESEIRQTEKPSKLHHVETDELLKPAEVLEPETETEQPLEIFEGEQETEKPSKALESEIEQTVTLSELKKNQQVDPAEILNVEAEQPLQIFDDEEDTNMSCKAPESEVGPTENNSELHDVETDQALKPSEVLETEKEQPLEISDDEDETEQPSKVLESEVEQTDEPSELHDVAAKQPDQPAEVLETEKEQSLEISDDEEETENPSKALESEIGQTVIPSELHDAETDQQVESADVLNAKAEQSLQISDKDEETETPSEDLKFEVGQTVKPSQLHDVERNQSMNPSKVYPAKTVQPIEIADDQEETSKPSEVLVEISSCEVETAKLTKANEADIDQALKDSDDEQEKVKLHEVEAAQPLKISVDEVALVNPAETSSQLETLRHSMVNVTVTDQPLEVAEFKLETMKPTEQNDVEAEQPLEISDQEEETDTQQQQREISDHKKETEKSFKEHEANKQQSIEDLEDAQKTAKLSTLHQVELEQKLKTTMTEEETQKPSESIIAETHQLKKKITSAEQEQPTAMTDKNKKLPKSIEEPQIQNNQPLEISDAEVKKKTPSETHITEKEESLTLANEENKMEKSDESVDEAKSAVHKSELEQSLEILVDKHEIEHTSIVHAAESEQSLVISTEKTENAKSIQVLEDQHNQALQISCDEQKTSKPLSQHETTTEKPLEITANEEDKEKTPNLVKNDEQVFQANASNLSDQPVKMHKPAPTQKSIVVDDQTADLHTSAVGSEPLPEEQPQKQQEKEAATSEQAEETKSFEADAVKDVAIENSIPADNAAPTDVVDPQPTSTTTNKTKKATKSRAASRKKEATDSVPKIEADNDKVKESMENGLKTSEVTATLNVLISEETVKRTPRGGLRQRGANAPKYDETSDTEIDGKKQTRKRRGISATGGGNHPKLSTPKKQRKEVGAVEAVENETAANVTSVAEVETSSSSANAKRNRKKKIDIEEESAHLETHEHEIETKVPKKRVRKNAKQANNKSEALAEELEEHVTTSGERAQTVDEAELVEQNVDESVAQKPKRGRRKKVESVPMDHKEDTAAVDKLAAENAATSTESTQQPTVAEAVEKPKRGGGRRKKLESESVDDSTAAAAVATNIAATEEVATPAKKTQSTRRVLKTKTVASNQSEHDADNVATAAATRKPRGTKRGANAANETQTTEANAQLNATDNFGSEKAKVDSEENVAAATATATTEPEVAARSRGGRARVKKLDNQADAGTEAAQSAAVVAIEEPTKKTRAPRGKKAQSQKVEQQSGQNDEMKVDAETKVEEKPKARAKKANKSTAESESAIVKELAGEIKRENETNSIKQNEANESATPIDDLAEADDATKAATKPATKSRAGRGGGGGGRRAKIDNELELTESVKTESTTTTTTQAKTSKRTTKKSQNKVEEELQKNQQELHENLLEANEAVVAVDVNDDDVHNMASKGDEAKSEAIAATTKQASKKRAVAAAGGKSAGAKAKAAKKSKIETEHVDEAGINVEETTNETAVTAPPVAEAAKRTQSRSRRAAKVNYQEDNDEEQLTAASTQSDTTSKAEGGGGGGSSRDGPPTKSKHVHFNEATNTTVPTKIVETSYDESTVATAAAAEKIVPTKRRRRN